MKLYLTPEEHVKELRTIFCCTSKCFFSGHYETDDEVVDDDDDDDVSDDVLCCPIFNALQDKRLTSFLPFSLRVTTCLV